MHISTLIQALQALKAEYGDLPVARCWEGYWYPLDPPELTRRKAQQGSVIKIEPFNFGAIPNEPTELVCKL